MVAVGTVFLVALISLLITRVATLALVLTGMSQEAARFQARSALTGTGFTTAEAESVVGHPVRRRIVMGLMLAGGAGIVTTIAALIIGFTDTSRGEAYTRLGILLGALLALLLISRTQTFNRLVTPLLARLLNRYTTLEVRDYAELLHLGGEWGIGEIAVNEGDWLACEQLSDLDLRSEGVAVLGIERDGAEYLGAPRFDTRVNPGDVLLLYGRRHRLGELDNRPAGAAGDQAHQAAVAEEARRSQLEREREQAPTTAGA